MQIHTNYISSTLLWEKGVKHKMLIFVYDFLRSPHWRSSRFYALQFRCTLYKISIQRCIIGSCFRRTHRGARSPQFTFDVLPIPMHKIIRTIFYWQILLLHSEDGKNIGQKSIKTRLAVVNNGMRTQTIDTGRERPEDTRLEVLQDTIDDNCILMLMNHRHRH